MKPYIIFNPNAGSVGDWKIALARLKELKPIALRINRRTGDAERWARRACLSKATNIIVAGGDGTLNEAVNGIGMRTKCLGIGLVPLGTGNDFARTLGLPLSIEDNIDILPSGKTRSIDMVTVKSRRNRYFVNVSAGGFSGLVNEKMTAEIKRTWGPLAYVSGRCCRVARAPRLQN